MKLSEEQKSNENQPALDRARLDFVVMISASVLTIAATFFLTAFTGLDFPIKTVIFGAIVLAYLFFCGYFYYRQIRRARTAIEAWNPETSGSAGTTATAAESAKQEIVFSPEIQEKLLVLEQANSFFSSSLKTADMFRLVSTRVNELIPFATCVLFLANEDKTTLRATQAGGDSSIPVPALEIGADDKTAVGKAFVSRRARFSENMSGEPRAAENLNAVLAVPVCDRDFEPYGVLALYGSREKTFDEKDLALIEVVSARVSPLFLSSLAFERSLENALVDSLTGLANQRAFYLVLENQLAESPRFGEQRPLTVLAIDIRHFDEINSNYGHATGDKVLNLTAKIIKGQLRQMDFLARAAGDEFLAILPTASEEITKVIIERIEKSFRHNPFDLNESEKIHVRLNFRSRFFLRDGETAQELLKTAALKKQKAKSDDTGSVIHFPRELVN